MYQGVTTIADPQRFFVLGILASQIDSSRETRYHQPETKAWFQLDTSPISRGITPVIDDKIGVARKTINPGFINLSGVLGQSCSRKPSLVGPRYQLGGQIYHLWCNTLCSCCVLLGTSSKVQGSGCRNLRRGRMMLVLNGKSR